MSFLIKNNRGFSIIGVLVASVLGLIVVTGLTKTFVHTNTQVNQIEQKMRRANLIGLLGNYINNPTVCKETLNQEAVKVSAGTNAILTQIKQPGGGTVIDLVAEKSQLKQKYGLDGLTQFQLNCEETGGTTPCKKCTGGSFPCPSVKWSLTLISQTYINGLPSFNRILKIPVIVTHTGSADSDFDCNKSSSIAPSSSTPSIDLSDAKCNTGEMLQGFDTNGVKVCVPSTNNNNNKNCAAKVIPASASSTIPKSTLSCMQIRKATCYLSASNNGDISGTCGHPSVGTGGSCEYTCVNGVWSKASNSCLTHRCP